MGYLKPLLGAKPSTEQNRLTPPPEPEMGLGERALSGLSKASQFNQEYLSLKAMEEAGAMQPGPMGWLMQGVPKVAQIIGAGIGAGAGAIGSGLYERMMFPPMLRSEMGQLPLSAQLEGTGQGAITGGEEAKKNITALDIAGGVPGKVGLAVNALDALLGTGDIYRGATEQGLTPGERAAQIGMGAFRVGANVAGGLHALKSPKVAADVASAKEQAITQPSQRMLPPPTAEVEAFRREAPPEALQGEISPQAGQVLNAYANTALQEVNTAAGGTPVQRVVLLPGQDVPLPDGSTQTITGRATVVGDTMFLTREGQLAALQGDDAAGVAHNMSYLVSHEVWHPKGEVGRATSSADLTTGQPIQAEATGPEGHAAGGLYDDRTKDLDQIFNELQLRDQVMKSPAMQELTAGVGERGMLEGAVQPRGGTSILEGTYHPEVLQLAHQLGYFGEGAAKPSIWEPANYPATPEVNLELQPTERMAPPPTAEVIAPVPTPEAAVAPGLPQAGGGRVNPEKIRAYLKNLGKTDEEINTFLGTLPEQRLLPPPEPRKPTPVMDALRGVSKPPPQPQVTDLAELPATRPYVERYRTQKNLRGSLFGGRLGRDAHFAVVDELASALGDKRLNVEAARKIGLQYGDLAPLENNLRQAINAKFGGINTPEGKAWLEKLQVIKQKLPRLTGANPRAVQAELGTATPRAAQAHTAMQERAAGLKPSKREVRQETKRVAAEAEFTARKEGVATAREKASEIITAAREPVGAKKTSNWATRLVEKIKTFAASGDAAKVPPKVREAVNNAAAKVDRTLGRETLEQARQKAMREAAGITLPPAKELPLELQPRLRPKLKQAGGASLRERIPEGTLSEVAAHLRELKGGVIGGPGFGPRHKQTTKTIRRVPTTLADVANPALRKAGAREITLYRSSTVPKSVSESPAFLRSLEEKQARQREAALIERMKEAPLPERKKPAPAKEFPKLPPGAVETRARLKAEGAEALKRPIPEVREAKKGVPTEGTFRVAPKKYPTPKDIAGVVRKGTTIYPRVASIAADAADARALDTLSSFVSENFRHLKKARLDSGVIEQLGASARLKEKLKDVLTNVAKVTEDPTQRLKLFVAQAKAIREGLKGEAYRYHKPAWSAATLEKPLAKATPEGKPTTFKERAGPHGARKWGRQFYREWIDTEGKTLEDRLGGPSVVAKELSRIFGEKVPQEWVEINGSRVTRQTAAKPGKVTAQTKMGIVGKMPELYSSLETAKVYAKEFGKADNATVARLPETISEGATKIKTKISPREGFEFAGTGLTSGKAAAGIPESLQPLKKGMVLPTGGHAGAKKSPDFPSAPTGGAREARAGLYGKAISGEAGAFEAAIETPRLSTSGGIASLSDAKAKALYVRNAVEESMQRVRGHIDELGATGRLVTPELVAKMKKKQYDYKDLVEEIVEGRRIDPDDEYYVNSKELAKYKAKFAASAENDFDAQVVEGIDARAIAQEQAEARRTQLKLSKPPEPLSPEGRAMVKSAQRLSTLPEMTKWVDRQITLGGLPQEQRGSALSLLQAKERKLQTWASREVPKLKQAGGGKREVPEGHVRLYSGGNSSFFTKNMARAADYGTVKTVDVPKEVFDAGRAEAAKLGQPSPQDTVLSNEWVKKAKEAPEVGPTVYELAMAGGASWRERVGAGLKHPLPQKTTPINQATADLLAAKLNRMKASKGKLTSSQHAEDVIDALGQTLNIGRPLLTAVDVSNPFRQTYQLTMDQITQDITRVAKGGVGKGETSFTKNTWNMLQAFGSKAKADKLFDSLHSDGFYNAGKEAGLRYISETSPHESWIGKQKLDALLAKLPGMKFPKTLIDGSERAFYYYQNKTMRDAFKHGLEFYKEAARLQPKEWKIDVEGVQDLAKHINHAASRGQMFKDPVANKMLNYALFSGQMLTSRVKMLASASTGFRTYSTPIARRYARRQVGRALAGAVAVNGAIFALAAVAGLKPSIETDRRSTDFGKIKVGNLVFDNGGGYNQLIRVVEQVRTGKEKERGTGLIKPKSLGDTLWNFARSKAAPGAGLLLDIKSGRTVEGEPIDFERDPYGSASTLVKNTLLPMSVSDINDMIQENPKAWFLVFPMLMGAGMGTDVPSSARTWRTTPELKAMELRTRQEVRKYGVMSPDVGRRVTLPGRDVFGRTSYYTLSPAEKAEFDNVYMPVVTKLLDEFLQSDTYAKLPEERRPKVLYKYVHMLNQRFGVATKGKQQYREKFKGGLIKPSNIKPSEKIQPLPGGGELRYSEEEED